MRSIWKGTLLIGFVLIVAGCDERALGTTVQSGSRLREQVWEAEGGAELAAGWWDSELGVACAPQVAADGITRCLPGALVGFAAAGSSSFGTTGTGLGYHEDAACTQRLKTWEDTCDAPPYTQVTEGSSCGKLLTRIHAARGLVTTRTVYLQDAQEGACTASELEVDRTFVRIGEEVPPATFAALSPTGLSGSGQLQLRLWKGEDGARLPRDLYDTTFEETCDLFPAADGVTRCLPRGATLHEFADPACQVPLATEIQAPGCAPEAPRYGRRSEPDATGTSLSVHVHDLAAAEPGGTSYSTYGEVCEEAGLPAGMVADLYRYPVEDEIPPASFVEIALEVEAGEGRLRRLLQRGDDGFSWPTITLWDETLQTRCRPQTLADGSLRCAPGSSVVLRDGYFDDDQCTVPARIGVVVMTLVPSEPEPRFGVQFGDGCGLGSRYYAVEEAVDASELFRQDAQGDCVPAYAMAYYRLGEELPASTFAQVTLVTR